MSYPPPSNQVEGFQHKKDGCVFLDFPTCQDKGRAVIALSARAWRKFFHSFPPKADPPLAEAAKARFRAFRPVRHKCLFTVGSAASGHVFNTENEGAVSLR
jgi:hypothetical protein